MKKIFYATLALLLCMFTLSSCSDDVRSRKIEKDGKQIGYIKPNLADNIYNKYGRNAENEVERILTYDHKMFIHNKSNQITKDKEGKLLCIFGCTNNYETDWYLDMTNINYANTDDTPAEGDAVVFERVKKIQKDEDKQMDEPWIYIFYRLSKGKDWHSEISEIIPRHGMQLYDQVVYVDKDFPKYAQKCYEEYKNWWNNFVDEQSDHYKGYKIKY